MHFDQQKYLGAKNSNDEICSLISKICKNSAIPKDSWASDLYRKAGKVHNWDHKLWKWITQVCIFIKRICEGEKSEL